MAFWVLGFLMFREKIFFEKMEMDNFIIMMNMIVIEKIIVIINNNNSLWALANYVLLYSEKRIIIIIIGIPRDSSFRSNQSKATN